MGQYSDSQGVTLGQFLTNRLAYRYWWLLCIVPVIILAVLVMHYSVHVPFWDSWEMVSFFQKHSSGKLGFSDFWMQHNEHRILFPNFLSYGLAQLTHWDPYYETVVNVLLGVSILSVLILSIKRTFKPKSNMFIINSILASWLVLSPIQWENWIWGWQIEWFLSALAVIFSLWYLSAKHLSLKLWVLAITSATIATYSLANGLVIWPIGLAIIIIRKQPIQRIIGWTFIGIVETWLYYHNYVNPTYHPSKSLFLHQPVAFIYYVLSYIGSPLTPHFQIAYLVGFGLLALFLTSCIYLWFKKRSALYTTLIVWLGVATYSLLSAVLTGISRLGFGIDQSYSSRYTTISSLFILATFIIMLFALELFLYNTGWPKWRVNSILLIVTVLFFIPILLNYSRGIFLMKQQHQRLVIARKCAETAKTQTDPCLGDLYPNNIVVWQRLQYLRKIHWGGF